MKNNLLIAMMKDALGTAPAAFESPMVFAPANTNFISPNKAESAQASVVVVTPPSK